MDGISKFQNPENKERLIQSFGYVANWAEVNALACKEAQVPNLQESFIFESVVQAARSMINAAKMPDPVQYVQYNTSLHESLGNIILAMDKVVTSEDCPLRTHPPFRIAQRHIEKFREEIGAYQNCHRRVNIPYFGKK